MGFNGAFSVAGRRTLSTLLFLPIDPAEVDGRRAYDALHLQAFMADAYLQTIAFVSYVLAKRPLLAPKVDVRALVVLPIF